MNSKDVKILQVKTTHTGDFRLPEPRDWKMFDTMLIVLGECSLEKVSRSKPFLVSFTRDMSKSVSAFVAVFTLEWHSFFWSPPPTIRTNALHEWNFRIYFLNKIKISGVLEEKLPAESSSILLISAPSAHFPPVSSVHTFLLLESPAVLELSKRWEFSMLLCPTYWINFTGPWANHV